MGAGGVSGVMLFLAALLAAGAGVLAGRAAYGFVCRRRRVAGVVARTGRERVALVLRRGCTPLRPAARWALGFESVRQAARGAVCELASRGIEAGEEAVLSLALAGASAAALAAGVATASPACALAVGAGSAVALAGYARSVDDKRLVAMREAVPEALRSMETCFRAGLSLPQTLRQTSQEVGGALGDLFDVASRRLEMGATTTEALSALDGGRRIPELTFAAVALDVQHQSGGSIGPVLEAARESVEGELELARSLRVQTAQAKLSARVVTLMPFVLVALFSLMSSDFLAPFFTSVAGMALLVLALGMQAAGVLLVRRMLDVEAR